MNRAAVLGERTSLMRAARVARNRSDCRCVQEKTRTESGQRRVGRLRSGGDAACGRRGVAAVVGGGSRLPTTRWQPKEPPRSAREATAAPSRADSHPGVRVEARSSQRPAAYSSSSHRRPVSNPCGSVLLRPRHRRAQRPRVDASAGLSPSSERANGRWDSSRVTDRMTR